MYDVAIVGAGPAGTTLARLISNKVKVVLLDNKRKKSCGGILTPEAQRTLGKFGISLPKQLLVDVQPFAVAVLDFNNRIYRRYCRQYVNIDRHKFDRWLVSLVPSDVDLRSPATYLSSEPDPDDADRLLVRFSENGEIKTISTRLLVGADGAHSALRRQYCSHNRFPKRYASVQHWYWRNEVAFDPKLAGFFTKGSDEPLDFWNFYVGIFDSTLTDFYCWTIPKDDAIIVGGAFPAGAGVDKRVASLHERLPLIGLKLGKHHCSEAGQIVRPMTNRMICCGTKNVLFVGEAAGFISPSSAEGISPALVSASALAKAIESVWATNIARQDDKQTANQILRQYRRNVLPLLWSLWFRHWKSPPMFNPTIRKIVMSSGLLALD